MEKVQEEKVLLNTKEVARFLNVNENMVYTLITENGLPATKVMGKWLFPRHLVEQWIENQTINYPSQKGPFENSSSVLLIMGSNDPLLEKTINLFNRLCHENIAAFGNVGSLGGIRALRRNLCHMATSHLIQDDERDYNFYFIQEELVHTPAVVNFCLREQGLLISRGNPKGIKSIADLKEKGIRIVNRATSTGTRLLFDRELKKAGILGKSIEGYDKELPKHMDVGIEIATGKADAGPGIRAIAELLGLEFLPFRWERYDLLIRKDRFFDPVVQNFLSLLHEPELKELASDLKGYDLSISGKMIFPGSSIKPAS